MKKLLILFILLCMTLSITACGCKHEWIEATCETPRTCEKCGVKFGLPKMCTIEEWETTKEPTCVDYGAEAGICIKCGKTTEHTLSRTKHTPGDWIVIKEPDYIENGKKVINCTYCGKELQSETIYTTDEEKEEMFREACVAYTYEEVARNPDSFDSKPLTFTGEIIQMMSSYGNSFSFILWVEDENPSAVNPVYVKYTKKSSDDPNLLIGDNITLYGYCRGSESYLSLLGTINSIPELRAHFVDIN